MTTPEARPAARTETPALEVKNALASFLGEFKAFQNDIKTKLKEQESQLAMLDRKSIAASRPPLERATDHEAPHKKAFAAYLRSGDDEGFRHLGLEGKALNTQVSADGGYLVDPQTAAEIVGVLRSSASIRAVANVVNVEATAFDVLVDHTDVGAGWASETAATAETGTPQVDRISIPLHELSAMPKASQRLLDDSAFDVEGWLAQRIADKFSRAEAAAFVAGDGTRSRGLPLLSAGRQRRLGLGQPRLRADRRGRRLLRDRSRRTRSSTSSTRSARATGRTRAS
jgi:HK97 family phage major capsid protein